MNTSGEKTGIREMKSKDPSLARRANVKITRWER